MWANISSGREWRGEFLNKKKNNDLYWESASISPIRNREQTITHFIAIKEDITKFKRTEEALLRAKEEAENATKLKDKFVSLVAHDIQSPFTMILGFLKLVLDDNVHTLHENHRKLIQRVVSKGEELVTTTKKLLEIGKLKTGVISPRFRFIDGYFTAKHIHSNLRTVAEQKAIELTCEVPRGTRLYADPDLFSHVLENLVTNAIKFCKDGEQITLFVPPDDKSTVAVKDTGVGIKENYKSKLFQYEEKTSDKGTSGEAGTGLGLPLCRDIMEAHGGILEFESSSGEGTTFYAKLPAVRPLIMLVDDDTNIFHLMKNALAPLGVDFLEAENGEEALKLLLADKQPHLIITDIAMPVMDGFGLLSHIKTNSTLKDIPVFVIAADQRKETLNKAFLFKADQFYIKPVPAEDLQLGVKKRLGLS